MKKIVAKYWSILVSICNSLCDTRPLRCSSYNRERSIAFWTTPQLSFKISGNRTRIANTTVHIVFVLIHCRVSALNSFVNTNPPFPIAIIEFFVPSHPPCGDGYSTSFIKQRRCYYTHYYLAPSAHRAIRLYLLPWVNYNIKQRTYYARGLYHMCIICPLFRVCYQKTGFYINLFIPSKCINSYTFFKNYSTVLTAICSLGYSSIHKTNICSFLDYTVIQTSNFTYSFKCLFIH